MYELASVRFPLNEHVCMCVCSFISVRSVVNENVKRRTS